MKSFREFLNESVRPFQTVKRNNALRDKPKFKLIDGSTKKKYIDGVLAKCKIYTNKYFKNYNDGAEQQSQFLDSVQKMVSEQIDATYSIPKFDLDEFESYRGDAFADDFSVYDLPNNIMIKLKEVCTLVAYAQKLIPSDWEEKCEDIVESVEDGRMFDAKLKCALYNIVCNINYLNDVKAFTNYVYPYINDASNIKENQHVFEDMYNEILSILF